MPLAHRSLVQADGAEHLDPGIFPERLLRHGVTSSPRVWGVKR
jgi:hypothetical protein